jgi:hypothetical protein
MSENPITEQLKKVADDVLTEETFEAIEAAFNESVESKADELAQLRVEKALVEQDEEHAVKLERLLEAIDTDHTKKLHRVVGAIDKNHTQKLVALVEKFRSELDGDANLFKEGLVDNISNYLDLYIEKAIPAEDIKEATKNNHAASILETLRKSLSIDNVLQNESVREAVIDGKHQIEQAKAEAETLAEQNASLVASLQQRDAALALEKLTEGLPNAKKRHMEKVLAGKNANFINENFEYTLQMFEKSETDKLDVLKEQATVGKRVKDRAPVDKKQVVAESVYTQIAQTEPSNLQDGNLFNSYMGELGRS